MDITIEKVETLMEKAEVSYEDAKDALMRTDGNLLDAVILLEQEGKMGSKKTSSYSTNENSNASSANTGFNYNYQYTYTDPCSDANQGPNPNAGPNTNSQKNNTNNPNYKYRDETTDFGEFMKNVGAWAARVLKGGMVNYFDVYRYGARIVHIPVLVLVILLLACFWASLPLLIIGLFLSCRYSFSGPHLGRDGINDAMKTAAETAETVKENFKQNIEESREKNGREDSDN